MAKYLTNTAKSQYCLAQCDVQKIFLLRPIVSITAESSLVLHHHRNCPTKVIICLVKFVLYLDTLHTVFMLQAGFWLTETIETIDFPSLDISQKYSFSLGVLQPFHFYPFDNPCIGGKVLAFIVETVITSVRSLKKASKLPKERDLLVKQSIRRCHCRTNSTQYIV